MYTGIHLVRTNTAEYVLDFDRSVLVRRPADNLDPTQFATFSLRKDEEEIPFSLVRDIEVGQDMWLSLSIIDGVATIRRTTPVIDHQTFTGAL